MRITAVKRTAVVKSITVQKIITIVKNITKKLTVIQRCNDGKEMD